MDKFLLIVACLIFACRAARADDWGYENKTQEDKPLQAQALPLHAAEAGHINSPFARGITGGGNGKTAGGPTPGGMLSEEKLPLIEECWAAIYELAAGQSLEEGPRHDLQALVRRKLLSPTARKQAESVLAFWPKLSAYLVANPQQRQNYAALMKALLRLQARSDADESGAGPSAQLAADEAALIAEVLGAQRLSVPGTVPFSEDAVNAYADMACFIYEQKNPGKSVDAQDNREIFANVVSEKFRAAPSKKDQEAMAGFDLIWAKFRIVWTQADEAKRAALLNDLTKSGAGAALACAHDPMLELVLSHWQISSTNKAAAASDAKAAPRK